MAYGGYGKKKTFGEKIKGVGASAVSGIKKLLGWTLVAGAIGGAGYYEYGTVQEREAKVTGFDHAPRGDDGKKNGPNIVYTDKGTLIVERSRFHFQSPEDADRVWGPIAIGKTYAFKTYGESIGDLSIFGNWNPNILKAREMKDEELQARALDKAKGAAGQPLKQGVAGVPAATAVPGQPIGPLTGEVVTYSAIVNSPNGQYRVQVTMPSEVVGKVTINAVTPLTPVFQQSVTPPPPPQPMARPAPPPPAPDYGM
jgi:hypothetical protein